MSRPPTHTAPPRAAAPASQHPTRAGLGLGTLLATSIGVIVGQVGTVSLLQGVGLGGWGFIGALAVAFALASLNAMAYAEMALLMPQAGSLSRYTEAALGHFPAILLVFAGYVAPCIFGLPAELLLLDGVVRQALPFVVPPYAVPVALVVLLAALNILGTDLFAKVQGPLSFTALGLLAVTAGVAWWSPHGVVVPLPAGAAPLGWQAFGRDTVFLGMIALAFWVFVGSEFVTPLTREARDPQRDLPRAMLGGLALIFGTQLAFALGTVWFVPRERLASSATPHVDYLAAVFGPAAQGWYAVFAVIASASLVNALFAAVPRMLGDMALRGQVFPCFGRRHQRHGTPVVAVLFVATLPLVGMAWSGGDAHAIMPLAVAAAVAYLLAYATAQLSLIVLRHRHPRAPRPYRMPGYPLTPTLAIAGMFYVMLHSAPTPAMAPQILRYTLVVLGLFAAVGACWVRFVMKKRLFEPEPGEPPF
jgi:amino acid transporter